MSMSSKENKIKKLHGIIQQYLRAGYTGELRRLGLYCSYSGSKNNFQSRDLNLDLLTDTILDHLYVKLSTGEHDGWTKTLRQEAVKAKFADTIAKYKNYGKKSEEEKKREEDQKMRDLEQMARHEMEFESRKRRQEEEKKGSRNKRQKKA